jgi:CheY-like chemotaxis protein
VPDNHRPDDPGHNRRRIVIADDYQPMRELLGVLVTASGLGEVVGAAANGREAVDLVLEHSPELALLDVEMPRMTGLAAAEVIATYRPATRVILHTGMTDSSINERARALGIPLVSKITDADSLAAIFSGAHPDVPAGEPKEIAAAVLAALERDANESVTVLDKDGNVVFYDSRAAEILGLTFPPRPTPYSELRARVQNLFADGSPRPLDERPIFRVLSERRPIRDVVFSRRGDELIAWASRAVPLFDGDSAFVAAAIYWAELGPAPAGTRGGKER